MTVIDKPHLDRAHVLDLLAHMIRIRKFEDKCAELYTQQKIRGFLHLYDGEEAIAAGVIPVLTDRDRIVATYREHGQALVRGVPMTTVMAEMYGKARAVPAGAAGRCTCSTPRRSSTAAMPSSGGGLPLAGGLALADKMTGEDRVTACFFGDGAVAEGEFHETLNLAELWDLPVLFVCENNGYAMGTAIGRYESQTDIRAKAAAYNIAAERSTAWTWSPSRPPRAAPSRHPRNRAALLPGVQHLPFPGAFHVRRPALPRQDRGRDVARAGTHRALPGMALENGLIHDSDVTEIEARVDAEIAEAVEFAEAGTWEPVENLTNHVLGPQPAPVTPAAPSGETVEMTYREAVKQAIRDAMIRDERVFLMGEDVGAYGGCYAVSKGLMDEFGEDPHPRHAAVGVRLHRGRDRRGVGGAPAHRGADDGQLQPAGARPDHEHGRHHPAHVGRAVRRADRDPHGDRCGQAAGRAAFPQPRGMVRAYPGAEGAGARHVEDARGMLWTALQDPDPVLIFENVMLYNRTGQIDANAGAVDITGPRSGARAPMSA
jgi:2-oxoisovalerate dehydrogenase E1 component